MGLILQGQQFYFFKKMLAVSYDDFIERLLRFFLCVFVLLFAFAAFMRFSLFMFLAAVACRWCSLVKFKQ